MCHDDKYTCTCLHNQTHVHAMYSVWGSLIKSSLHPLFWLDLLNFLILPVIHPLLLCPISVKPILASSNHYLGLQITPNILCFTLKLGVAWDNASKTTCT